MDIIDRGWTALCIFIKLGRHVDRDEKMTSDAENSRSACFDGHNFIRTGIKYEMVLRILLFGLAFFSILEFDLVQKDFSITGWPWFFRSRSHYIYRNNLGNTIKTKPLCPFSSNLTDIMILEVGGINVTIDIYWNDFVNTIKIKLFNVFHQTWYIIFPMTECTLFVSPAKHSDT